MGKTTNYIESTILHTFSGFGVLGKTISILVFLFLFTASSYAQKADSPFSLRTKAEHKLSIHQTFISSTSIQPFEKTGNISALAISGVAHLLSDNSSIRVILVDSEYNEYLVFEIYSLLATSESQEIEDWGEETVSLNNITPLSLRVEVINAEFSLQSISLVGESYAKAAVSASLLKNEQQARKLEKIKAAIKSQNLKWVAGSTPVSGLSYAEKKSIFGGEVPNLNGFEYYQGGVFSLAQTDSKSSKTAGHLISEPNSQYVKDFDWRNRHGKDWTTPAKNQGFCSSCWAHSTTGAAELLVNLYFNRELDLDLSEQDLIDNVEGSSCSGGFPGDAFRYMRSSGIVDEAFNPYRNGEGTPIVGSTTPGEKITISSVKYFADRSVDNLKDFVLNGPVSLGINSWRHTVTLLGYKELQAGDTIRNQTEKGAWVVIEEGDELIGKTAWIIKNSWGPDWGDGGFAYLVLDMNDISSTYQISGAVSSLNLSEADVLCTDADGDGYYYWGIGPKPAHCPPCPDEPDSDDSNKCIGPADNFGNSFVFRPEAPIVKDSVQCEFENASLIALGNKVKWYADEHTSSLLDTGLVFTPGYLTPGQHSFYATQIIGGCESEATVAQMNALAAPAPPIIDVITICEGDNLSDKLTKNSNIHWYENKSGELSLKSQKPSLFNTQISGKYELFATHQDSLCESETVPVEIIVRELPDVNLGVDKTISTTEHINFAYNEDYTEVYWFDGYHLATREIMGEELGVGEHLIWLELTDTYSCTNSDSMTLWVDEANAIAQHTFNMNLIAYPNPSNGHITLKTEHEFAAEEIVAIEVINLAGQTVWTTKNEIHPDFENLQVDISDLYAGTYYLTVKSVGKSYSTLISLK